MTWLDRTRWGQIVRELWPLILFVLLMLLLFVVFTVFGCQPQPCLPSQTSVAALEQPPTCEEIPLTMPQLTTIQAGP